MRRRPLHGSPALTINELVIVIVLTAILAGLAIFSTSTLISRTKYSRVKEDHRLVARALQNYQMDYSALPAQLQGLRSLERPTAYLSNVPSDPFVGRGFLNEYIYLRPRISGVAFVLISRGPDGDFDLPIRLNRFLTSLEPERVIEGSRRGSSRSILSEYMAWLDGQAGEASSAGGALSQTEDASWLGEVLPSLRGAVGSDLPRSRQLDEERREVLEWYLDNLDWRPEIGQTDGDIITVVRY